MKTIINIKNIASEKGFSVEDIVRAGRTTIYTIKNSNGIRFIITSSNFKSEGRAITLTSGKEIITPEGLKSVKTPCSGDYTFGITDGVTYHAILNEEKLNKVLELNK